MRQGVGESALVRDARFGGGWAEEAAAAFMVDVVLSSDVGSVAVKRG